MGSCNRLRSSILIAWSVARLAEPAFHCRRPYPPDGRGLVPGIQYPRVAGYEMVGIVDAIGTNVSGCTAGHRVGARAETLSPARLRPSLCIISEVTKASPLDTRENGLISAQVRVIAPI